MEASGLVYTGAFRVPDGSSDSKTFAYGGSALSYNTANKSLFMAGLPTNPTVAEISIPAPGQGAVSGLPGATLLQDFRDPSEGKAGGINPAGGDPRTGGTLVYNGKLIVTYFTDYDATNAQNKSHFSHAASLSAGGGQGPLALSGAPARWLAGYMGAIPSQWQAAFGGPALTGLAGVNIASAASNGPAAAVFNPDAMGSAALLLGYALDRALPQLYDASVEQANPFWNFTSQVRGVAFPDGTRSVLFFGRHGLGAQQYGVDPQTGYKGYYAYPYVPYVWAYDALDLLAVKAGTKSADSVKPYAVWQLPISGNPEIGGAAYDPETKRIFVSQIGGDDAKPLIHVLRVSTGG